MAGDRALIMAIVNRTPDSFYDRGATFTDDAAKAAGHRAIADGADVVDIGGVKAGPGSDVDADEEIARVVPFIAWLRGAYPDQLISVDTWRAAVAKQACAAGADLINDTWAGADPGLAEVAAEFGAGLVCSHTGGAVPRTRPFRVNYGIPTRRGRRRHRRGDRGGRTRGRGGRGPGRDPDRSDPRFRQEHLPRP